MKNIESILKNNDIIYEDDYVYFLEVHRSEIELSFKNKKKYNQYGWRFYYLVNKDGVYSNYIQGINYDYYILCFYQDKCEIYDKSGHELTMSELIKKYPSIKNTLYEISNASDVKLLIKNILEDESSSIRHYFDYSSTFELSGNFGYDTVLTIKYKKEQVFKILGYDTDENGYYGDDMNKYYFDMVLNSSYNQNTIYSDRQNYKEDPERELGTVFRHLNPDNKKEFINICRYILPNVNFKNNQTFYETFLEKIKSHKKIYDLCIEMLRDFGNYMNSSINENLKKKVDEFFNTECLNGINFDIHNDTVEIKIRKLIYWQKFFNYDGDVLGLINEIFGHCYDNVGFPDLESIVYGEDLNDEDEFSFNSDVETIFEKIIDILDNSGNLTLQQVKQLDDKIGKILPLNKDVPIPKDTRYTITYNGIDYETGKIHIIVKKYSKNIFNKKVTEDDLYNLMYHPTLFGDI